MDLAALVHATSVAISPATIAMCICLAVRALVILVVLFGKKDRAERALDVLRVLRRK
jgi:hypothetical protein